MEHKAMQGFVPKKWNDHQFAVWLQKHKAINDWFAIANMNCWRRGDEVIAVAIYDNAQSTRSIYIKQDV